MTRNSQAPHYPAAAIKGLLILVAVLSVAGQAKAGTTTYKYDALGRVIEVLYSDGSKITYTYDAAGNRTQVVRTAGS
jgi:YD repeat-containing protein